MIRIKFHGDWDSEEMIYSNVFPYSQNGTWRDSIKLVRPGEDFDYLILINKPKNNLRMNLNKIFYFYYEPMEYRKRWGFDPYEHGFAHYEDHCFCCWYLNKDYQTILNDIPEKTKLFSGCISGKTMGMFGNRMPGYTQRLDFVKYLNESFVGYEHFGKPENNNQLVSLACYKGSPKCKSEALYPFKYTLAAENCVDEYGYFTEKILDGILSECLVFYSGHESVSKWIDPEAFIHVDLSKPQESLKVITEAINNNEWEKRIKIIRKAKMRILNETQIFPRIETILKQKGILS